MSQPLVSIITINFNQTRVTGELLESLRKLRWNNYEVIVVDNGSEDHPGEFLSTNYPETILVESSTNLGFSGGNNLGMRIAKGEFFFLVNNDTELHPDAVSHLIDSFKSTQNTGMACPKILYFDHPDTIQYAGYTKMNPFTARNKTIGQYDRDQGQWDEARTTWFGHGAAMFVSRMAVEKAGLMPEIYFLYYEELDWSHAMRSADLQIRYIPESVVYHKESVSVGKLSTLKTYYLNRNRILFMRRNAGLASLIIFLLYWIFIAAPIHMAKYVVRGRWNHLRVFLRAMIWHFTHRSRIKPEGKILQS